MRTDRRGMILLNVLIVVAIAAAAVTSMVVAQDIEVQRAVRLRDAAQAAAYGRAGELSAVVALRRDKLQAPGFDALSEPWAAIGQTPIDIPGGRFSLSIEDEQARFNVNSLAEGEPIPAAVLARIADRAGASPAAVAAIATVIQAAGPLRDEGLLRTAGVDPADLERLAPWIAFLPPEATLNLNTADAALLEAVLGDAAAVRTVVARRRSLPFGQADAATLGSPGLVGGASDNFRVAVDVRVGGVRRVTLSRLRRRQNDDVVEVDIVSRRRQVAPTAE